MTNIQVMIGLNQEAWNRGSDAHAQWARETHAEDKAMIERLGLAAQ